MVVLKFDPSGTPLWERHLESAFGLFNFRAATMDAERIYLAGAVFRRRAEGDNQTGEALADFLAAYDMTEIFDG